MYVLSVHGGGFYKTFPTAKELVQYMKTKPHRGQMNAFIKHTTRNIIICYVHI